MPNPRTIAMMNPGHQEVVQQSLSQPSFAPALGTLLTEPLLGGEMSGNLVSPRQVAVRAMQGPVPIEEGQVLPEQYLQQMFKSGEFTTNDPATSATPALPREPGGLGNLLTSGSVESPQASDVPTASGVSGADGQPKAEIQTTPLPADGAKVGNLLTEQEGDVGTAGASITAEVERANPDLPEVDRQALATSAIAGFGIFLALGAPFGLALAAGLKMAGNSRQSQLDRHQQGIENAQVDRKLDIAEGDAEVDATYKKVMGEAAQRNANTKAAKDKSDKFTSDQKNYNAFINEHPDGVLAGKLAWNKQAIETKNSGHIRYDSIDPKALETRAQLHVEQGKDPQTTIERIQLLYGPEAATTYQKAFAAAQKTKSQQPAEEDKSFFGLF
jgi:hypothetical protein